MKLTGSSKGLTFIEVIVASFVLVFAVLGTLNLISRVYESIFQTNLKTYSFNIATENLEIMKTYNFGALKLTPDSMLPEPLSKLETDSNPWGNPKDPDNITTVGRVPMRVYRWVQYASEDDNGNIIGRTQAELPNADLKVIKVVVAYDTKLPSGVTVTKQTALETLISNPESAFGGVTIRGRVMRKEKNCSEPCNQFPPGHMAEGAVYIEGHPEYVGIVGNTSNNTDERGYYTITGVMPGTYNLYVIGDDFESGPWAGNPLVIDAASGDVNGVNFLAPRLSAYTVAGTIRDPDGNPVNYNDYKPDAREVRCDDGTSNTTTTNSAGQYYIDAITPDAGSVSVTAVFVRKSDGQGFFGQYPSRIALSGNTDKTGIDFTIYPVSGSGIVRVISLDARDRITKIPNVNLVFTAIGNTSNVYAFNTGGGADLTTIIPVLGAYNLAGSAPNYVAEEPVMQVNVTNNTPVIKLYLFPAGNVSGTIIEEVTGLPPTTPINIQAFSDYNQVGSAFSNTTTGQYYITGVHTGTRNRLRIYPDGSQYDFAKPENGVLEPVSVNQGSTTSNQNFTVRIAYKPISGEIKLNSDLLVNGVMIIAQPTSNTVVPHAYSLDSTDPVYRAQNALRRMKNPQYGVVAQRNGTYELLVPGGESYNVYAYYTNVSYPAGTVYKYYKVLNSVSPGSATANFSGSWTPY